MKATPFHTVLVANRGEISLRVMRSARALGLRTVAVYSDADTDALHVRAADRAVCIGPAAPAQSYLNIPAIIEAARASGADAVHPGYGFLAENAAFAQACREAGLVFIGPSPEAIAAMGDKAGAKVLMAQAGVPCIPGYQGPDQGPERLQAEADRLGYPVMIKASAGGGGRGMRRVERAQDFAAALRSAQSEAGHAFGDATVILERALSEPRHIEIQVFADRHGQVLHLGERDCSVQRRHQKLIEEAPSPGVDAALRERMGDAGVTAVRALGYEGAGTLEFLLDREGRHYFMEMNTRLQVEHPVTEALTGLDLVEWQLRLAAGEPLPLAQADVSWRGHAIEVRLCAEDAAQGFLPQSGTLQRWQAPAGLRVEHALQSGCTVPPHYDSMVAKLIAHGSTREEARRKLLAGLQELQALGLATNQAFLQACLQHPVFVAGQASTAFIEQQLPQLLAQEPEARSRTEAVAAWLLVHSRSAHRGHALAHRLPLGLRFVLDGQAVQARVRQSGPEQWDITQGERVQSLRCHEADAQGASFTLDGVRSRVAFVREADRLWLQVDGRPHAAQDQTLAAAARGGAQGGGQLRASMSARVVSLQAELGQRVAAGQPLLTLEAMKMEHVHVAGASGTLAALHVGVGDQVAAGRLLAEIAGEPGSA